MFQPEIATTWLAPDGGERRGEVAIDLVAKPDHDAGREASLGLRDRGRQGLAGGSPHSFKARGGIRLAADDGQRAGSDGAVDADPREIVAVWTFGRRLDPSVDPELVARLHGWVAGERCRHRQGPETVRRRGETERRHLLSVARGGDACHRADPRPTACRELRGRSSRTAREGEAQRDGDRSQRERTERGHPSQPAAVAGWPEANARRPDTERRREKDERRRLQTGSHEARDDRANGEPRARRHSPGLPVRCPAATLSGRRRAL